MNRSPFPNGPDPAFLRWLSEDCGYLHVRPIGSSRYAAVYPMMVTAAIITGVCGDFTAYEDRWCYHSIEEARAALDAWDGTGEPSGWHRHPATGRRVSESLDEVDGDGRTVGEIGSVYVRA